LPQVGLLGLAIFLVGTLYITFSYRIFIPPEMKDYNVSAIKDHSS